MNFNRIGVATMRKGVSKIEGETKRTMKEDFTKNSLIGRETIALEHTVRDTKIGKNQLIIITISQESNKYSFSAHSYNFEDGIIDNPQVGHTKGMSYQPSYPLQMRMDKTGFIGLMFDKATQQQSRLGIGKYSGVDIFNARIK